jgi:hypothetical protein
MKFRLGILAILLTSIMACVTPHIIAPIYPKVGNPNFPTAVDSLQPTLRWQPVAEPDASYDLIIHEIIKTSSFWEGTKRSIGGEVYYRQGLKESKHKIEEPLKPDTEYCWSVRVRRGEAVSDWAEYDYDLFLGTAYVWANNAPFMFKTPNE